MLEFIEDDDGLILTYRSDQPGNIWVWEELRTHHHVTLSKGFSFQRGDLLAVPDPALDRDGFEEFVYEFRFATREDGYFRIEGRVLDIENPVLIVAAGLTIERKLFLAERGIGIFGKIADLMAPDQEIVVGGPRPGSIPIADYQELLRKFPNTGELNRYASARVASIVGDYIEPLRDARRQYETYLNRRSATLADRPLAEPELIETEIAKYVYIRDTLTDWLREGATRSESDWQKMIITFLLLIFPKYVAVLSNVKIPDAYSTPGSTRDRFIDLALVDAGGSLDVIEIKKPFDDSLLGRRTYRDNYIPAKELAGSVMQAEKYLFHLTKWGLAGEKALTKRYADQLPPGVEIRITNPKAMIILGRDRRPDGDDALSPGQRLDLEIIKRKFANMIDVLTYDDLLRRLDAIIVSLQRRAAGGGETTAPPLAPT